MSASQLIYDKLFEISEELGYDTYDFLPPENNLVSICSSSINSAQS